MPIDRFIAQNLNIFNFYQSYIHNLDVCILAKSLFIFIVDFQIF